MSNGGFEGGMVHGLWSVEPSQSAGAHCVIYGHIGKIVIWSTFVRSVGTDRNSSVIIPEKSGQLTKTSCIHLDFEVALCIPAMWFIKRRFVVVKKPAASAVWQMRLLWYFWMTNEFHFNQMTSYTLPVKHDRLFAKITWQVQDLRRQEFKHKHHSHVIGPLPPSGVG